MEITEIDKYLLTALHERAKGSERLRMNYDLRTSVADGSQRMLNALEVGTQVPVHRHLETSETAICLEGSLDVVIYDTKPNNAPEAGTCVKAMVDGVEVDMYESIRIRLCPAEGHFGVQIPVGAWHSVDVHEPSTIFEAKDGAYKVER